MVLENKADAHSIYQSWFQKDEGSIPEKLVHRSIQSYKGINLADPYQRDQHLFPPLRHNMKVINFFLSEVVYPIETKVSTKKLMCTAWDLCSEQLKHCVTGFSGTNDTKDILPLPIVQNDLPQLENTNKKMERVLLDSQIPRSYESLPQNSNAKLIITTLVKKNIPVLLDSGALVSNLIY